MNKQELEAIRERCEKTTPGPWQEGRHDMATHVDGDASKWIYAGDKYLAISSSLDIEPWDQVIANAEFIAHARTDIPALLAEIDRLQAERDAYGCEFCLDDADNEPESIGTGLNEFGQECKYLMVNDEPVFEIKYCPMCGKGLEGRG